MCLLMQKMEKIDVMNIIVDSIITKINCIKGVTR